MNRVELSGYTGKDVTVIKSGKVGWTTLCIQETLKNAEGENIVAWITIKVYGEKAVKDFAKIKKGDEVEIGGQLVQDINKSKVYTTVLCDYWKVTLPKGVLDGTVKVRKKIKKVKQFTPEDEVLYEYMQVPDMDFSKDFLPYT